MKILKSQITCPYCHAELEIEANDFKWAEREEQSTTGITRKVHCHVITCPICGSDALKIKN